MTDFLPGSVTDDQCADAGPCPHSQVTDAMIDAALKASVPGGSEVWCWLPQKDAWTPSETARDVMRCALRAGFGDLMRHRNVTKHRLATVIFDAAEDDLGNILVLGSEAHNYVDPKDAAWSMALLMAEAVIKFDGGEAVHGQVVQPIRDEQ